MHAALDGALIETDRVNDRSRPAGNDRWYSGKHHRHGANVQVLADAAAAMATRRPCVALGLLARAVCCCHSVESRHMIVEVR